MSENLISNIMPFNKEPLKAELNELATNLFHLSEKIALLSKHYPTFELRDWHMPFYQWEGSKHLPIIKEALSIRKLVGQYYQLQQPLRDYQAYLELFIKEEISPITADLCTILSQNKALYAGSNVLVINSGKYDYAKANKHYAALETQEKTIAKRKKLIQDLYQKKPKPLHLCYIDHYKAKGIKLNDTVVKALINTHIGKLGYWHKVLGVIPYEPLSRLKDNYHLRKS